MKKELIEITKNCSNEELKELLKDVSDKLKHSPIRINNLEMIKER